MYRLTKSLNVFCRKDLSVGFTIGIVGQDIRTSLNCLDILPKKLRSIQISQSRVAGALKVINL